jgi:hypothetical protein
MPALWCSSGQTGHRQLGVVVEDRARHTAEGGERRVVAVAEGLGPLGRVRPDEAGVAVRQVQGEEVDLAPLAADHRHRLAEVGLGMTGRVIPDPLEPCRSALSARSLQAGLR